MRRSGWFERRLLIALILFSLIPSFLVIGAGTLLLRETVSLQTTPAGWERLAESGRELLERVDTLGDAELRRAAVRHRMELTASVQQAQRWGYLSRRALASLPGVAVVFGLVLSVLAIRSARRIARGLAQPIRELVGWAERVARGDALPPAKGDDPAESGEFGILRASFRRMEEALGAARTREVEAARLRGSVVLARGVAHELKNTLMPLQLAIAALRRGAPREEDLESLEVIEAESRRLEALARTFSQLGQTPEGERSSIDIGELMDHLVRSYLPPQLETAISIDARLPQVEGYYDPLARAFSNLLLNAAEAIGEAAGKIEVSAEQIDPGWIEVRIADNGPGISSEQLERLWDPDFTTKARGTGLGLALVHQTIDAHEGQISVARASLGGAEFRITLPVGVSGASAGPARVPRIGSGRG